MANPFEIAANPKRLGKHLMSNQIKQQPRPPAELTDEARSEWDRCMRLFYSQYDFIEELDRGLLAAYCQSYGRWAAAEAELKASREIDGFVVRGVRGGLFVNPLIGIVRSAARDMVGYADMLGMTPLSRAKILAALAEPEGPIGKKEAQLRSAMKIASGQFAPSAPPRLVLVDDDDELR